MGALVIAMIEMAIEAGVIGRGVPMKHIKLPRRWWMPLNWPKGSSPI
ncbi:hypothetical protein [Methylovorus sp. MP688]|nr:hypothetical protein [Methylovorus sp. MP688]ADQ84595.1 hypothetical protein MPQ_1436 [Methylovorus sp. MP688]